jgi:rRNA pseudouridine-1189 N-methylase Emg1 (Nep1/Mra1 family)
MHFFVFNCGHHSVYIFKEGLALLVNESASNKAKKKKEGETNRGLPDITHLRL